MPENVNPSARARPVFVMVSAVLLLSVSGCASDKEVGLCSYLLGCGTDPYPTDPGVHHTSTPYDYGTYDDPTADDDDGDDGK